MDRNAVRQSVKSHLVNIDSSLRANPAKWTAIAAGAGLGLGVLGRLMRGRMRGVPKVVLIETFC